MAQQTPNVKVRKDGPYVVSGSVPLRGKEPIVSEHGEPLTWRTGKVSDHGAAYTLCRCGRSANKPYCDGTHTQVGFDGTETAATNTSAERQDSYPGTGIEVRDDRSLCFHAGFCGNRITNVWKMADKTDDTVVRAQVMAMIERCPSGALTYDVEGDTVEPDLPIEVAVIPDGPLWITGGVPIERSDGESLEVRNRIGLCRCGHSANKPLCDGSHREAGFVG